MFQHQFAKTVHFRHGIKTTGIDDPTLVITSNIPLRKSTPEYSQPKVDELVKAAVGYAKEHGVRIEFLSVD